MTSTRDVQVQADTARSHAPIIEAVYARDAARLDSEIEAHITHAYDQIMQSFLDDTVKSVGELPSKLFNKEAKT